MRTIAIDFNNPIEYENMVIGNIGEHNATELILTPPSKIADCEAVKSYIVAFVVGGMVIHSEPFSKTETLSVKLWKQLTEEPVMGIQLEAYDENENFIGKSELISSLRLSPSACGDDTVADTDNPDIISAIAANTSARHTHTNIETLGKLGDSNGSLTYGGKPVGGDTRPVIEETFTEEFGDFAFVLTASNTYPVKNAVLTVASDSITENTEIKSIKILFSGKTDYVDVKDIPIKYNGYFEPCIVSAFHPVADDGSESLVVGFKVASLYFPVDCKAYTDIRNGSYSAVKVEYYGG